MLEMSQKSEEESKEVLEYILEVVKEVSALPECPLPWKKQYCNLVRRVKFFSPFFEELIDCEMPLGKLETRALISLKATLESAKDLLRSVNEGSKLYQALKWEENANRIHEVTEQLEKALSQISFDRLDIFEEVHEQVEIVHAQFKRAKGKGSVHIITGDDSVT